jgi:hypothetical protein
VIIWLSVAAAAVVVAGASAWMVNVGNRREGVPDEVDRSSLPDEELGL